MKRVLSIVLMMVLTITSLVVVLNPIEAEAATMSADELKAQVSYTYNEAKRLSGRSSFNGYCATMVGYQLWATGINNKYVGANGNSSYNKYENGAVTAGGYTPVPYPASSGSIKTTLNLLTNNGTTDVYNILVGFEKGANNADGQTYGHVMFINGIIDGTVYFCESYNATVGGKYYSEGSVITCSISTFASYYNSACTQFEGIIHFTKEPIEYANISDGNYYLNNNGYRLYMLNDSKATDSITANTSSVTSKHLFTITRDGNNYIINPKDTAKNYVLHCYWSNGKYTQDGDRIALWDKDNDLSQRWIFEEYGDGYLIHPAGTPNLAITRDTSTNEIYVNTTTKATNQIWKLEVADKCNHNYTYTDFGESGHKLMCTNCNSASALLSHDYSCSTCYQVCSKCNAVKYGSSKIDDYFYTYENDGVHTEICKECGKSENAMHRVDGEIYYSNDIHWLYCIECKCIIEASEHNYKNDCDTTCNTCDYTRAISHTFDNDCDPNCNVCGVTRSTTHAFSNDCDPDCNICGAKRAVTHIFDNQCDYDCNICGAKRAIFHEYPPIVDGKYTESHCPICGMEYEYPDEPTPDEPIPETPTVKDHSQCKGGGLARFFNALGNFFRILFGLPPKCICGEDLY